MVLLFISTLLVKGVDEVEVGLLVSSSLGLIARIKGIFREFNISLTYYCYSSHHRQDCVLEVDCFHCYLLRLDRPQECSPWVRRFPDTNMYVALCVLMASSTLNSISPRVCPRIRSTLLLLCLLDRLLLSFVRSRVVLQQFLLLLVTFWHLESLIKKFSVSFEFLKPVS